MNILTTEKEKRLHTTIQLIDKIVEIGQSALMKFPTEHYEILVFSFINYLERFTSNLDSINILLRNYKNKPNVETAIGLILRASLLDFMTITYLSTYQAEIKSKEDKEGEENFNIQFNGIITDQICNTIKFLKLARDTGLIKQNEYETTLKNIWCSYDFLFKDRYIDFETPEKKLISSDFISPKQLFIRIHNHTLTKKYSKVYDLYTYYGKYEHFGIMTYFIQNQENDNTLATIIDSIKYMVVGIGTTFAFLSYPKDRLKEEREKWFRLQSEFQIL